MGKTLQKGLLTLSDLRSELQEANRERGGGEEYEGFFPRLFSLGKGVASDFPALAALKKAP